MKQLTQEQIITNLNAAKEQVFSLRCPKCENIVILQDTSDYSHETCWRPMKGTIAAANPLFYVACSCFCWKGPAARDPLEAVEFWNEVMKK